MALPVLMAVGTTIFRVAPRLVPMVRKLLGAKKAKNVTSEQIRSARTLNDMAKVKKLQKPGMTTTEAAAKLAKTKKIKRAAVTGAVVAGGLGSGVASGLYGVELIKNKAAAAAAKRKAAAKKKAAAAKKKAAAAKKKAAAILKSESRRQESQTTTAKDKPKPKPKPMPKITTKASEKKLKTSLMAAVNAGDDYYFNKKAGRKMAAVTKEMLNKSGHKNLTAYMNDRLGLKPRKSTKKKK